jgi:hypothetical protein
MMRAAQPRTCTIEQSIPLDLHNAFYSHHSTRELLQDSPMTVFNLLPGHVSLGRHWRPIADADKSRDRQMPQFKIIKTSQELLMS